MKPMLIAAVAFLTLAATASAQTETTKLGARKCFERHRVVIGGVGSQYMATSVAPRSHQLAISFPFTPGEAGLSALVFFERTPAAAHALRERLIQYSIRVGHGRRADY